MMTNTDMVIHEDEALRETLASSPLQYQTPSTWVQGILADFPRFLADHASNERKAAAIGMEMVVRYPDRLDLVTVSSRIAIEEIEHFRQVFALMRRLNAPLRPDEPCAYPKILKQHIRPSGQERLLDQLLVNSLIEWRGMERFGLVALHHPEADIRAFYRRLSLGEKGHASTFLFEAKRIFPSQTVMDRFEAWLPIEAQAIQNSPCPWQLFGSAQH